MAFQDNLPLPQGQSLQERVEEKVSSKTGHLEDQSLDLDARTMAILGKRQQLSVRPLAAKMNLGMTGMLIFARWVEKFSPRLVSRFLNYVDCVMGVDCMVSKEICFP